MSSLNNLWELVAISFVLLMETKLSSVINFCLSIQDLIWSAEAWWKVNIQKIERVHISWWRKDESQHNMILSISHIHQMFRQYSWHILLEIFKTKVVYINDRKKHRPAYFGLLITTNVVYINDKKKRKSQYTHPVLIKTKAMYIDDRERETS